MLLNADTIIEGVHSRLVPYKKRHVIRYHEWMQSESLREATASEPLSLDEEFIMQETWLNDDDKLTFIVLDQALLRAGMTEEEAMVGDVNIFLIPIIDEDCNSSSSHNGDGGINNGMEGELEIMIAEEGCRGKGLGREVATLMMNYAKENLISTHNLRRFSAKIAMNNTASRRLFCSLGFHEVSVSDVFKEISYHMDIY